MPSIHEIKHKIKSIFGLKSKKLHNYSLIKINLKTESKEYADFQILGNLFTIINKKKLKNKQIFKLLGTYSVIYNNKDLTFKY